MSMRKFFAAEDGSGGGGSDAPQGLSIDQAVSKLGEQRKEQAKAAEKPAPKPVTPAAPAVAVQPVVADDEEQEIPDTVQAEPGETEQSEEIAAVAEEPTTAQHSDMPPGWGEADRAIWAALTPEAQAKLVTREKQRESGIRKQLQSTEAAKAEATKQIEALKAERQKLGPALQSTRQVILQQLVRDFPDVNPKDPNSLMRLALDAPERKVAFDALWNQLGQNVAAEREHEARQKHEADAEQGKFAEARIAKLLELEADLSDPVKSQRFETDVVGFLVKDNPYGPIEADRIKLYSAEELLIARDGMRYRKAMAALKAKPPAVVPKVAKPGAAVEGGKSGEVAALEKRLKKTGDINDAIALRKARLAASTA